MEKRIPHKSSKLSDGVVAGCWVGFLHSFDIHQHLHLRKLLGQRKGAKGLKDKKAKIYLPPAYDEDYAAETEKDVTPQLEDRSGSANKNSGKAQMRAVIGREISKQRSKGKQKGQKQKANPSGRRLLRTISIHHMECDDYVLPGEMPHDSKLQEAPLIPQNSGSSASKELVSLPPETVSEVNQVKRCKACGMLSSAGMYLGHYELGYRLVENQVLLREKIRQAKNKLIEHQSVDGKDDPRVAELGHSKDLLETLELFNANRDLILEIIHEKGTATVNSLQVQEDSRSERVLSKSGSFPGTGFSGRTAGPFELRRRHETARMKKRAKMSDTEDLRALSTSHSTEAEKAQVISNAVRPVSDIQRGYEIASKSEWSPNFTHVMKTPKDNETDVHRFKDIKQRIKNIIKENKEERHRISMDGVIHKVPYGYKVAQEKPSRFDGDGSRNNFGSGRAFAAYTSANGHMRRSHSLTESMDRYSCLLESNFSREPRRQTSERLKLAPEDSGFQAINSPRTFKRMLSLPDYDSYFLSKDDQSESSMDLIHSSSSSVDLVQGNPSMHNGTDEQKMPDILESSLENIEENGTSSTDGDPDKRTLGDIVYTGSGTEKIESTHTDDLDIVSDDEWSDKPTKSSPISAVEKDLANPAEFSSLSASLELVKPREAHIGELEPFDSPENQYDINDSSTTKTNVSDIADLKNPAIIQQDFDALPVPVDHMHEFHFVRDMLKKHWFNGEEHLARWNPPCLHQLSSSTSEEAEDTIYELETSNRGSDISFSHEELLLDLTNEVLLETYEDSYGHHRWLSLASSRIRPVPAGCHVLEEVWAKISGRLKSQPRENPYLESIIRQDFKKNDRWMNLPADIENMELDLELQILDDLLDEVTLECLDVAHQQ